MHIAVLLWHHNSFSTDFFLSLFCFLSLSLPRFSDWRSRKQRDSCLSKQLKKSERISCTAVLGLLSPNSTQSLINYFAAKYRDSQLQTGLSLWYDRLLSSFEETWNWSKRWSVCFLSISYLNDSKCHIEKVLYMELS